MGISEALEHSVKSDDRLLCRIVKASSGTSLVVPYNFENNFMMLGDVFVATYTDKTTWQLPDSVAGMLMKVYETAQRSPVFGTWPYNSSITNRLNLLRASNYEGLYNAAQNYALTAMGPDPANPHHYPACMTCHQKANQ